MDPTGLLLDILGVVLLFFNGIPSRAGLDGMLSWGRGTGANFKRAQKLSRLRLLLLVAGFGLQILSNYSEVLLDWLCSG